RNTKSGPRTTPVFSVRSAKRAQHTRSKTGPARNDAVDCGCAGCADKSASLRQFFVAHVAELADAYGSGPYGATRGGSSPLVSSVLRHGVPKWPISCSNRRREAHRRLHCSNFAHAVVDRAVRDLVRSHRPGSLSRYWGK